MASLTSNRTNVSRVASNIPLRRTNSKINTSPTLKTQHAETWKTDERWRIKFEEAEKRRKNLLSENEKCKFAPLLIYI